jgi:hypothetical protein
MQPRHHGATASSRFAEPPEVTMLVKGLVLTAMLASTPIAIVATQDKQSPSSSAERTALQRLQEQQQQAADDLARARDELAGARAELQRLKQQLDHALTALDKTYEPQRDRNCSPTRNRALMSHYQWLRNEGHGERAAGALAKVVEQVGNDQHQRNSAAWELMTNKDTVGKCDEVALAIAEKMEQTGANEHHHLDTMALANFLNGRIEKAIELEQKAIAAGGSGDDYRRRLRTYEAARDAVARTQSVATASGEKMVAANDDQ